jgi:ubiquitin-like modifier-activating enzyme ATG7
MMTFMIEHTGCAVARVLIGWGVRTITFIDNGKVSYSNPARQCLYTFDDCVNREHKAIAAASRLKQIYPDVQSNGYVMSIPMPGHPLHNINGSMKHDLMNRSSSSSSSSIDRSDESNQDINDFYHLEDLIKSHDVCFTLTDSREARWLPTMLCTKYNKVLINSALGFDSYLVMYHDNCRYDEGDYGHGRSEERINDDHDQQQQQQLSGQQQQLSGQQQQLSGQQQQQQQQISGQQQHNHAIKKPELGCYFCNDVVAAQNSTRDRSIDQQCTVTRPGLSFIAAGLAVEIMVAVLQKKKNKKEKESMMKKIDDDDGEERDDDDNIPHQIRGNVNGFSQLLLKVSAILYDI